MLVAGCVQEEGGVAEQGCFERGRDGKEEEDLDVFWDGEGGGEGGGGGGAEAEGAADEDEVGVIGGVFAGVRVVAAGEDEAGCGGEGEVGVGGGGGGRGGMGGGGGGDEGVVGADREFDGFLALEAVDAEEVLLTGPEGFVIVGWGDGGIAFGASTAGCTILSQFGVDAWVYNAKLLCESREDTPCHRASELRIHHDPIARRHAPSLKPVER